MTSLVTQRRRQKVILFIDNPKNNGGWDSNSWPAVGWGKERGSG
jgi:hypothetical protein